MAKRRQRRNRSGTVDWQMACREYELALLGSELPPPPVAGVSRQARMTQIENAIKTAIVAAYAKFDQVEADPELPDDWMSRVCMIMLVRAKSAKEYAAAFKALGAIAAPDTVSAETLTESQTWWSNTQDWWAQTWSGDWAGGFESWSEGWDALIGGNFR